MAGKAKNTRPSGGLKTLDPESLQASIESGEAALSNFQSEVSTAVATLTDLLKTQQEALQTQGERAQVELEFKRKTAIEDINTRLQVALASISTAQAGKYGVDDLQFQAPSRVGGGYQEP